jgi:polar amino acid transport system permease protein
MQASGISVLFQGSNFLRLLDGLWVTIRISMIAVAISIVLGILIGMLMTIKNPVTKALTRFYLEFIRIMPQLVLLFLVYFGVTKAFGIHLSGELSAILVFSLWGTAEMGDLVRGALTSIPKHQYESGKAIGLTGIQVYIHIIIPQTVRRLIPLAMNLITRMIRPLH